MDLWLRSIRPANQGHKVMLILRKSKEFVVQTPVESAEDCVYQKDLSQVLRPLFLNLSHKVARKFVVQVTFWKNHKSCINILFCNLTCSLLNLLLYFQQRYTCTFTLTSPFAQVILFFICVSLHKYMFEILCHHLVDNGILIIFLE